MPEADHGTTVTQLSDGRQVLIRPSRADDAASVAAAMRTASPATLRNRFLVAFHALPEAELRQQLEVRSPEECCLVAVVDDCVIAGVRFVRSGDPDVAEFAITVHDRFQRQGLGTTLMRGLIAVARARDIRRLVGEALDDNQGILALLSRFGPVRITRREPGVRHLELELGN